MKKTTLLTTVLLLTTTAAHAQTQTSLKFDIPTAPKILTLNQSHKQTESLRLQVESARPFSMKSLTETASRKGNEGGGGGDPTDIAHIKRPVSKSEIQSQIEKQRREAQALAEAAKRQDMDRLGIAQVRQLSNLTVAYYRHLTALGYPFEFPGGAPSVELIEKTLSLITAPPGRVIIDNSLTEKGSPVLFFSDPVAKTMRMNTNRFLNLISKNDSPAWYVDYMTIMFHEALVLNKIEASRTYSYSAKFKVALSVMLESPDFQSWKAERISTLSSAERNLVTRSEAALAASHCRDYSRLGILAYSQMIMASLDLNPRYWQQESLTPAQLKAEDEREKMRESARDRYSEAMDKLHQQSLRCPQY